MNFSTGRSDRERGEKALAEIADFQSIAALIFPDEQTVREYALVKAELVAAGTPIPENDVCIAALAREYDLPIATRDQYFALVHGIKTVMW